MPHVQTRSHNTSQSEPQGFLFKTVRMGSVVLPDLSLPLYSDLVNSSLGIPWTFPRSILLTFICF